MCDDGASFLTLESGLEEVPDPSFTTLHIIAPSLPHTVSNNTMLFMTFPNPSFPLAQLTEFEIGETFGVSASVYEDDICCESSNIFIKVHDLHETFTGTSCVDVVVARPASPDYVNNIYPNPLDTFHPFSSCSLPPSP